MTIDQLRATAMTKTPQGSLLPAVRVDTDDLLALLDAVEAAQEFRGAVGAGGDGWLHKDEIAALAAFDAALARLGR